MAEVELIRSTSRPHSAGWSQQEARQHSPYRIWARLMALDAFIAVMFAAYLHGLSGASGPGLAVAMLGSLAGFAGSVALLEVHLRPDPLSSRAMIIRPVVALVLAAVVSEILLIVTAPDPAPVSQFALAMGVAASASIVMRVAHLLFFRHRIARGDCMGTALLVTVGGAEFNHDDLAAWKRNGLHALETLRLARVAELGDLVEEVRRHHPDRVILTVDLKNLSNVIEASREFGELAVEVLIVVADDRPHPIHLVPLQGRVALRTNNSPLEGWSYRLKRSEDVALASAALIMLAPLMLLTALLIKIDSPGPIFFRQKRTGINGRVFEVMKFRSMDHGRSDAAASRQTSRNDDRVTRVGRVIRRTSIDELPQLINVLEGTMSLVGPRPHALGTRAEGKALEDVAGAYRWRHRVKPGITGLAQVSGYRGELDSADKVLKRVEYDLEYIENWSLWLDMRILFRTVMLVLGDRTAY